MQFEMPTLIETKSPEACAALCRELELSFIELNMNMPEYQADRLDAEKLRRIADKYDICYTVHLDENLNPCDFNEKVAAAYTETVLHTIETAKQLSISVLNMHLHSGVYFTLPNRKVFLFAEYEHEYMQKLIAFRDACETAVGDADIKICVENCSGYKQAPFMIRSLDTLLKSPVFALTLDIGHNAGTGFIDEPIIMERAYRLCHMHIHDAKANEKCDHLTLGEGKVDLIKYLNLAKTHDCRAVIEVKTITGLRRSVEWLKERGLL